MVEVHRAAVVGSWLGCSVASELREFRQLASIRNPVRVASLAPCSMNTAGRGKGIGPWGSIRLFKLQ
jgi:hypothetical protein